MRFAVLFVIRRLCSGLSEVTIVVQRAIGSLCKLGATHNGEHG